MSDTQLNLTIHFKIPCSELMNLSLPLAQKVLIYLLKLWLSQNPSATNKALDLEGWFNTGDIGWIAPHHATGPSRKCGGMLVLEGRAKDTIVLTTGMYYVRSIYCYHCTLIMTFDFFLY